MVTIRLSEGPGAGEDGRRAIGESRSRRSAHLLSSDRDRRDHNAGSGKRRREIDRSPWDDGRVRSDRPREDKRYDQGDDRRDYHGGGNERRDDRWEDRRNVRRDNPYDARKGDIKDICWDDRKGERSCDYRRGERSRDREHRYRSCDDNHNSCKRRDSKDEKDKKDDKGTKSKKAWTIWQGYRPKVGDIERATTSALSRGMALHRLPYGVVVAAREGGSKKERRRLQAGEDKNTYYCYCVRCRAWSVFESAPDWGISESAADHDCNGPHEDACLLEAAKTSCDGLIDKMREAESRGHVPELIETCQCRDLRNDSAPAHALQPGLQMLRFKPKGSILPVCLEYLVSLPELGPNKGWQDLPVVLWLHGKAEDVGFAPLSPKCITIAPRCPIRLDNPDEICSWFMEGPGGAFERFDISKLRVSERMFVAVLKLLEEILHMLKLPSNHKLLVMGVSMGGAAALDFAKRMGPERVSRLAVLAGYYDTERLEELAAAIHSIPLRVVHHRKDVCVQFAPMEALIAKRKLHGAAKTVAIISDEQVQQTHQISEEERSCTIEWLLEGCTA